MSDAINVNQTLSSPTSPALRAAPASALTKTLTPLTGVSKTHTADGHTFGTRFREWMKALNKRPYIMHVRGDECIVWANSYKEATEHAADAA